MSGGSNAPSAPNLTGNIQSQNNTSASATSDAGQTFNTAQAYNQNAQDTLSQVNGANTPLLGQVGSTANANLNEYQNNFMPLQQQQVTQAQNYGSDQNIENLQGQATADSNASVQASLSNQKASLASEGVDPASIGGSAITQQAGVAGAAQNAQAANASRTNTINTANQLTSNANQLGLQVGQGGTTGAQAASGIGSSMVTNQNSTNSGAVNNLTAANPYLSTSVNANQSAANISGTQFQDQLIEQQANQAASNSNWAGIGTVGGIALGEYANSEDGGMERGGVVGYPKPALPLPWQQMRPPGAFPATTAHYDGGGDVDLFGGGGGGGDGGFLQAPYNTGFNQSGMSGGYDSNGGGMVLGNANPGGANPGAVMGMQQNYANAGNWDAVAPMAQPAATPNYSQGSSVPAAAPINVPAASSYAPSDFGANAAAFGAGFASTQKGGGGMATGGIVSNQGALPTSPIPGSTDTKPAWLTPGEFVIPRDAASWKGHEHWFKEVDKARAGIAQRHGLPPPMSSAMTARGH